jgi:hypothetical protein
MSHYASGRWNTFKLNYMINQSKLKKITISTFKSSILGKIAKAALLQL